MPTKEVIGFAIVATTVLVVLCGLWFWRKRIPWETVIVITAGALVAKFITITRRLPLNKYRDEFFWHFGDMEWMT